MREEGGQRDPMRIVRSEWCFETTYSIRNERNCGNDQYILEVFGNEQDILEVCTIIVLCNTSIDA